MTVLAGLATAAGGAGGGLSLLGTAFSAISSLAQGAAESRAANFQAEIDRQNAEIAEINAANKLLETQKLAKDKDTENEAFIGEQVAAMGASGVVANSGSSLLVVKSGKKLARVDNKRIREAGRREAENFRQQKANDLNSATLNKQRAKSARTKGFFSAASSILGASKSFSGSKRIHSGSLAF